MSRLNSPSTSCNPPTMKALMSRFLRSPALATIPIPQPERGELQLEVAYVSLNPTDYKHAFMALPPSKVIGCDFSGRVTALGSEVDRSSFAEGDRVAGVIHGCHYSHAGAFAQYLVADANMCYRVPDSIPLEQACTVGVGWISAMQALHQRLYCGYQDDSGKEDTSRIERPDTFIVALASKQHHANLRKLGADVVFDYRSPSIVQDVRALGRDVRKAIDCHSEGSSTVLAAQCMLSSDQPESTPPKGGRRIIRTLPPRMISGTIPPGVQANEWILSYTALGKPFWFLFKHYPASSEDYNAAKRYLKNLTPLLEKGELVPVNHRLMAGGLGDIGNGFKEMAAGKVRGEKLVYRVAGGK
ncbi:MAG: hypothetical protein M1816_006038 [Peltula sp. TS41687]|nr:MAG: hypothetical protein M1816_006038 [Peltula sp. TS41687]